LSSEFEHLPAQALNFIVFGLGCIGLTLISTLLLNPNSAYYAAQTLMAAFNSTQMSDATVIHLLGYFSALVVIQAVIQFVMVYKDKQKHMMVNGAL